MALASHLATQSQPVAAGLHLLARMATEASSPQADLPAVQLLCQVRATDLAMMAAALTLGVPRIGPSLCGRGHQVAKALHQGLADQSEHPSPWGVALQNIAPILRVGSSAQKLTGLSMLLDQNTACNRSDMRSASSI